MIVWLIIILLISGFRKLMVLSPVLAEVVGQDKVSTKVYMFIMSNILYLTVGKGFLRTVNEEIS